MSDKIGDSVVMNYCKSCEEVFQDDEEGRCPRCWDTKDTAYAILRFESVEERDY